MWKKCFRRVFSLSLPRLVLVFTIWIFIHSLALQMMPLLLKARFHLPIPTVDKLHKCYNSSLSHSSKYSVLPSLSLACLITFSPSSLLALEHHLLLCDSILWHRNPHKTEHCSNFGAAIRKQNQNEVLRVIITIIIIITITIIILILQ